MIQKLLHITPALKPVVFSSVLMNLIKLSIREDSDKLGVVVKNRFLQSGDIPSMSIAELTNLPDSERLIDWLKIMYGSANQHVVVDRLFRGLQGDFSDAAFSALLALAGESNDAVLIQLVRWIATQRAGLNSVAQEFWDALSQKVKMRRLIGVVNKIRDFNEAEYIFVSTSILRSIDLNSIDSESLNLNEFFAASPASNFLFSLLTGNSVEALAVIETFTAHEPGENAFDSFRMVAGVLNSAAFTKFRLSLKTDSAARKALATFLLITPETTESRALQRKMILAERLA
jgi:hypothetical protein